MTSMRSQRCFDLLFTIPVVLIIAPLMAIIALLIRFTMGKPVCFHQLRPGFCGKPFTIHKFRTMTDGHDTSGQIFSDGERLTALGRFLRSTSLDELPEFINILKGDMSLVGPRPLLMCYLERYTPEQMRRHEVRPGLTGWAQINGRNAMSWEERFKLDIWYVEHRSFWLDLRILAITIWKVLRREGISQPGHATMKEFMGSKKIISLPTAHKDRDRNNFPKT